MRVLRHWKHLALAAGAAVVLTATAAPLALAHPHVQVQVRTTLLVKDGAVIGLRHVWVMDEQWRLSQLELHDKNSDGTLSEEELAPLVEESKATLELFKSFTTLRHGSQRIRPAAVQQLMIGPHGDRLGLTFVVKLAKPVPLAGSELLLEVYDGTYFSAFSFAGPDSVDLDGERPRDCVVNAAAQPSPQQLAVHRMMTRQLGPEFNAKAALPQAASVSCGKGMLIGGRTTPGAGVPADATGLHMPVSTGR
jgi:ABC-type uncharacterized transport system substrate-binding protein